MLIKNINGTTVKECRCGSWMEHWKKYSKQEVPARCPEHRCYNAPEVASLVQKEGDGNWYIVPLCMDHGSMKNYTMEIMDTVSLVSTTCN